MKAVDVFKKDGTFVGTFPSVKMASEVLGVDASHISKVLNGKRTHTGGYVFVESNVPNLHQQVVESVETNAQAIDTATTLLDTSSDLMAQVMELTAEVRELLLDKDELLKQLIELLDENGQLRLEIMDLESTISDLEDAELDDDDILEDDEIDLAMAQADLIIALNECKDDEAVSNILRTIEKIDEMLELSHH